MKKVMLIDPGCLENAENLKRVIEKNYNIYYLTGENSLMKEIDSTLPDIVILNCGKPGCDAIEACADAKKNPLTKETPVIIMSQMGTLNNIEKALRAGADSYIVMPAPAIMVLDKIADVLEKYSGRKVPEPMTV